MILIFDIVINLTKNYDRWLESNFRFSVSAQGFGMRVVGGKVGSDGHLFAQILLISPGGPAEKAGLQAGDKVR